MFSKFKGYPIFTKVLIISMCVVLLGAIALCVAVVATGGFNGI